MELMNPCGVFETKAAPLVPPVTLGPDVTVGLFATCCSSMSGGASPTPSACASSAGS